MSDPLHHAVLESVMQTAVDGIVVTDESGSIESANPAIESMYGRGAHEVRGQNVKLLLSSVDHDRYDRYVEQSEGIPESDRPRGGRAFSGQRKNGSPFPIVLAVNKVDTGKQKLFAVTIRDVSELKSAESEVQQLKRALDRRNRERAEQPHRSRTQRGEQKRLVTLGRVSGGIVHEIRNPLNTIKTSAYYLINAKAVSAVKTREHLTRIERQITKIENVMIALSDLALLDEPKPRRVDLATMIRGILEDQQIPQNIAVVTDFGGKHPAIRVDAHQLSIVFRNLICNAQQAMPDGGRLVLTSELIDHRIVVKVSDNGIGMAPEVVDRITEPFFSTKTRGMGLGLAIVAAILEKNACTMKVESEPGVGTTFRVSVGAADASD